MRKFLGVSCLLFLCLFCLPGATGCDEKAGSAFDLQVQMDANGRPMIGEDGRPIIKVGAGGGVSVPKVVDAANDLGKTIPGPWTPILGLVALLFGTGGIAQTVLKSRLQTKYTDEQEAHVETKNTLAATTSGMVSFAKANPTMAAPLMDHVDAAHDVHDVDPAHQDAIQSALSPPKIG